MLSDDTANSYRPIFDLFSKKIAVKGYRNSERLYPKEFPLFPGEPVVRCRYDSDGSTESHELQSTLMQLGAGVFTVNGVQPYSSWDEFGPAVATGVGVLEEVAGSHIGDNGVRPILRYIDAFEGDLIGGRSLKEFLSEVFGVIVAIPDALGSKAKDEETSLGSIALNVPLSFGNLSIKIGEGFAEDRPAIICDMTVTYKSKVRFSHSEIMTAFNGARDVIHTVFVGMTSPIHDRMR